MSIYKDLTHFDHPRTVAEYTAAARNIGLWESEIILFEKYIPKASRVLDLGCGAGRVAFGLKKRGYREIIGVDLSELMIDQANALLQATEGVDGLRFEVQDARELSFEDASFDGIIFSFNGLMQIQTVAARLKVLREVRRVLKPGGVFIFTTHDRDVTEHEFYWNEERSKWANGGQDPRLKEFGDRICETSSGDYFIHIPRKSEILEMIEQGGFELLYSAERSAIVSERLSVRNFSDDCIFWVVK